MGTMGKGHRLFHGKMSTAIRPATEADTDTIHQLLDMEPFKYDDGLPYERSWIEQLVTNERCLTLLYETDGLIKGFISGEVMVSGAVMLWFCAVLPQYQQKNIGIRLYQEFEKACKARGYNAILAYGFKTSASMLNRLQFHSGEHTYKEFYKPLKEE